MSTKLQLEKELKVAKDKINQLDPPKNETLLDKIIEIEKQSVESIERLSWNAKRLQEDSLGLYVG